MREFGVLEYAIMDALWRTGGRLSVREISETMDYKREIAYTTVMTVTTILYHKGLLHREKRGRAWRYWPRESRDEHTARMMSEILDSSSDQNQTILRFIERCSDEVRTYLRHALHERGSGTPGPTGRCG